MQYATLGNTADLRVSRLCLGSMQFGWTADRDTSFAILDAFADAGGNFIDSADIYYRFAPGNEGGEAETIIGEWMRARGNRTEMVIATKVRGRMWDGPDGEGLSREHIMRACDDSLRRLGTDTIDLYQCHWPDEDTPIAESLATFRDLQSQGKIRYYGLSNYDPKQLREVIETADREGLPRPVSLQPHYNLVHRAEFERELRDLCQQHGLGVIPYSPLGAGFLTGKYRPGKEVDSVRSERVQKYATSDGWSVVQALDEVAGAHQVRPAAVALAWLMAQPGVTGPILGANSVEQLADQLPAADLALLPEEVERLTAVSAAFA